MREAVILSPTYIDQAINLPVIDIVFYDENIELSKFDAVIFTSKQAIYAIDRLTNEWKNLKIFSIGGETSKAAIELGASIEFEAEKSYGDLFANSIARDYGDLQFFYPRAKVVSSNIEAILSSKNIAVESKILYETICKKIDENKIDKNSAIVFSSPSVVECFFAQIKWQESWIAVAIGDKTAAALKKYTNYLLSPEISLLSAARFAKNL
ncbi:hypothetical protein FACS189487_08110 [Campylobacterota bacterium]|nr:hypothetical protein FACS189487_08110 [Campylobacterota bacterium]